MRRVTVVVLCVSVCLCVCVSVPASAFVYIRKQRYTRVSLRLFLDYRKKLPFESYGVKKANESELTASRFRPVSGPTKHSSYVKGNWWVE